MKRFLPLLIIAIGLCAVLGYFQHLRHSNAITLLEPRDGVDWIVYPTPLGLRPHLAVVLPAEFDRAFGIASVPAHARLTIRALRHAIVTINNRIALVKDDANWKSPQDIDVAGFLQSGSNQISVQVKNPTGPPALWLALDLPRESIRSDEAWNVTWAGATPEHAIRADGPRSAIDQQFRDSAQPARALRAIPISLIIFALISGAFIAIMHGLTQRTPKYAVVIAFAVPAAIWIAMVVHNHPWVDGQLGFDLVPHLEYAQFILDHGSLPLADDGWMMYQPPLYYLLVAGGLKLFQLSTTAASATAVIRTISLTFGLAELGFIFAALRLLFPNKPRPQLAGLLVAVFLPMHLILVQYATNETLAAATCTAAIYFALRTILIETFGWRNYIGLGACFGLAMLSKFSVLVPMAIVLAILLARAAHLAWTTRDGAPLIKLAGSVALILAISAWHYARVWIHFGNPLVANWDLSSGISWWQDPGYRTLHEYLSLGKLFAHPMLNPTLSVWDQLAATLFGDGLISGVVRLPLQPPWSYQHVATGYLLAIVPALLLLIGMIAAALKIVRRFNLAWTMLLAIFFGVLGAIILYTLQVPHYTSAKGFYGLIALLPFCALVAMGFEIIARFKWPAIVVGLALGIWSLNSLASYWVDTNSATARVQVGRREISLERKSEGEEMIRSALAIDSACPAARLTLSILLSDRGDDAEAAKLLAGDPPTPDDAKFHQQLALLAARAHRGDDFDREARLALALDPDDFDLRITIAQLRQSSGDSSGAIEQLREALRIDPFQIPAHRKLALLYRRAGETQKMAQHLGYAEAISRAANGEK